MQLVGATNNFIRRPFLLSSIIQGIIGAIIAILLLMGLINMAQNELSGIISLKEYEILTLLFVFVILIGITITAVSSFVSVNKYLRMKSDELYY